MALGIYRIQKPREQVEVRDMLLRHALRIKPEVDIGDLVREDVAEECLAAFDLALDERQLLHLPADVGKRKKRDRRQSFRRLGAFLPLLETLVHLDDAFDLLARK